MDPDRRAALLAAKLTALVKAHWGDEPRTIVPWGGGSALRADGRLWVLAEDAPIRSLGSALALADREGTERVDLIAAADSGALARRARLFAPQVAVWRVEGTALVEADPEPWPLPAQVPAHALVYEEIFLAAGATPVREAGVLRAEVLGLEVARVTVDEEGVFLEVGVGKHDREAHRMVHGDRPPIESLASAVAAVAQRRRVDALPHEMNQIAEERWLRANLIAHPHQVGAQRLWATEPGVPRFDLRASSPAPATGDALDGRPLVVVASTGIDVDLVPTAADIQAADPRQPHLRIVVPEGDDHPLTRRLMARLVHPADLALVSRNWKAGLG